LNRGEHQQDPSDAEAAVIAAKVKHRHAVQTAEMYAGSAMPGKNRLNAKAQLAIILGDARARFSLRDHPANHRCW